MSARAIFVGGTASHVGKSWIATAICRWLRRRGYRVAPFKAQNMSNNSAACANGCEIGRAQAVQAEACEIGPEPDMNPILLKPEGDMGCQVVLNGKVWNSLGARAYHDHFEFMQSQVLHAYARLAERFEYVVIEGAGSVAELNLKKRDLVNLGLARQVGARALLVADVDRGGVFASLIGTIQLLEPDERAVVRSWLVNRFRGDPSLFSDGLQILRERTGMRGLGNLPYLPLARIPEEDSVSLEVAQVGESDIAIVRLPRISNFTDFDRIPNPRWVTAPDACKYRAVILPGTKNTIADLQWLREQRLDEWILRQHAEGATLLGICGGFQMLGEFVLQNGTTVEGLNLLPVTTVMTEEKTVRVVKGHTSFGTAFEGYEIHMGETTGPNNLPPFARTEYGGDGARVGNCVGTYVHGVLEHPDVVREVLGVEPTAVLPNGEIYDRMADYFEQYADIELFEELYL